MKMTEKINQKIDQIFPELVKLRREIHQHPELSWKEFETTDRVENFLQTHGYSKFTRPLETGLICDLVNYPHAETLAIRADLDALPISDAKKVEYRSRKSGVSHACGHDVHTAIVCGIAAVLKSVPRRFPANLRFIFQPAEEPIPTGAPKMVEKGALNGVKVMWGMHVEPVLPVGTISLTKGWVNAQSIRLKWEIKGRGGHSARPHQTADPLWAGTSLVQQCYQSAYRQWSRPDFPVILSFTKFSSGNAYNAIPDTAVLEGTLRLTSAEKRDEILDQIKAINRTIQAVNGVKIKFIALLGSPPVVNDAGVVEKLDEKLQKSRYSDLRVLRDFRSMGGDDFGYYSAIVPSAMVRFGVGQGKNPPGLHTGMFDVPEEVIKIALRFFVEQVLEWNT